MDRGQEVSRILDYHVFILKYMAIVEEKKFKLFILQNNPEQGSELDYETPSQGKTVNGLTI